MLSLGKLVNEIKNFVGYYEKEALLHEVGIEAFDSGLLIGHKDEYRLLTLEADVCVTFPHELIGGFSMLSFAQEFLVIEKPYQILRFLKYGKTLTQFH